VNKLGAELDGPLVKLRMYATADSIARFENYDFDLRSTELTRRGESCRTCADNYNVSIHTPPLFAKI